MAVRKNSQEISSAMSFILVFIAIMYTLTDEPVKKPAVQPVSQSVSQSVFRRLQLQAINRQTPFNRGKSASNPLLRCVVQNVCVAGGGVRVLHSNKCGGSVWTYIFTWRLRVWDFHVYSSQGPHLYTFCARDQHHATPELFNKKMKLLEYKIKCLQWFSALQRAKIIWLS